MTGISNKEVDMLSGVEGPFSVESDLNKASGGKYEKAAEPFGSHVVVSKDSEGRAFVTGQNPASGLDIGKAIYQELFKKAYEG